ncbi:MMPL family transporter [Plantactinospora sp. KLBMP9567]|uniref:MMPL family transporter n=1 Tax=Plantactinospora sp. KLBMP9567 TaxID=3085900 RepID=UPI002981462D|nr:MMPL family transporter [Plantactinospora sp. KLBMP9567]MDW5326682.1 MMPL family transporter [Plantactinospora sp. KLBMP9567]
MFERWGSAVVRHPVRVIATWLVLVMGLGGLGYLVLGPEGVAAVAGQNEADFLPERYESVQAARFAERAFPSDEREGASAVLVLSRADGAALGADDQSSGRDVVAGLGGAGVRGVSEPTLSPNGKIMLAQVTFTDDVGHPEVSSAVSRLRAETSERLSGTPLRSGYTGEAAVAKDSELLDLLVSVGMIVMILVLLVVIFRSPWVALLNLLVIALVGQGAVVVIAIAAKATGTTLDGSVTGLLPVVLFGVGTDYVVFLLYRYRERLRLGEDRRTAMVAALGRVGSAIGVSALAVAVSFGALLLSGFGSFRILGPALAFAVLVMVLAGLTLIPAVFSLLGHRAFWPSKAWRNEPKAGLAARTGDLVARRPVAVALAAIAILAALGAAALPHRPSYDIATMPAGTESARTMQRLESGFPAGTLSPTSVYLSGPGLTEQAAGAYAERLAALPIVGDVGGVRTTGEAAQVDLLLAADPFSEKALDAMVHELRPAAHAAAPPGSTVHVGGETSIFADVRAVVETDLRVILPAAGLLIGLVLLLMLRGVLAPVYLLGAVVGGFVATLGAAVLVFQGAVGRPGLSFTLPLIVYMFVASIGTDYNILIIARIREELRDGASRREAVRAALRQAAPPVAAAGVILAASFGALTVSATLAEVGFAVAVGVLLSTFVLSWLLVPALTALLGRAAFWPAPVGRTAETPAADPTRAPVSATMVP